MPGHRHTFYIFTFDAIQHFIFITAARRFNYIWRKHLRGARRDAYWLSYEADIKSAIRQRIRQLPLPRFRPAFDYFKKFHTALAQGAMIITPHLARMLRRMMKWRAYWLFEFWLRRRMAFSL